MLEACSWGPVHILATIKELLPDRITLNHKSFKSKKETANCPNPAANRNYFPPSLWPVVSGITSTDTRNYLNKRTWSPPRSGRPEQDVVMKIQVARSGCDPSLLWPIGKKMSAGNSVYEERRYEGSTELQHCFLPASAPFWRSVTENDYHKIKIVLAGSFSKNCCIHVKSQKTSVLQSLKQFKTLLTFLNLFYNLLSDDHQNNAVLSPVGAWFGPCDWHIHYLGLSYCAFIQ